MNVKCSAIVYNAIMNSFSTFTMDDSIDYERTDCWRLGLWEQVAYAKALAPCEKNWAEKWLKSDKKYTFEQYYLIELTRLYHDVIEHKADPVIAKDIIRLKENSGIEPWSSVNYTYEYGPKRPVLNERVYFVADIWVDDSFEMDRENLLNSKLEFEMFPENEDKCFADNWSERSFDMIRDALGYYDSPSDGEMFSVKLVPHLVEVEVPEEEIIRNGKEAIYRKIFDRAWEIPNYQWHLDYEKNIDFHNKQYSTLFYNPKLVFEDDMHGYLYMTDKEDIYYHMTDEEIKEKINQKRNEMFPTSNEVEYDSDGLPIEEPYYDDYYLINSTT